MMADMSTLRERAAETVLDVLSDWKRSELSTVDLDGVLLVDWEDAGALAIINADDVSFFLPFTERRVVAEIQGRAKRPTGRGRTRVLVVRGRAAELVDVELCADPS